MAASLMLLQNLVFRTSSSSLFLKPFSNRLQKSFSTIFNSPNHCSHSQLFRRHRFFCNSASSSSLTYTQQNTSPPQGSIREENESDSNSEDVIEIEIEEERDGSESASNYKSEVNLSVKERKELAAYAHSLGKKLKTQQVGKSGVTSSVAAAFVENLEANELLKLKVHNNCPGEFVDVVKQLEEATGSVAVFQIGRSVILYRPSLSKLKAKEKKEQAARVVRKGFRVKWAEPMQRKGQVPRLSGRGRRGNSRRAATVTVSSSSS